MLQCKRGEVGSASSARPEWDENGMPLRTGFEVHHDNTTLVVLVACKQIVSSTFLACSPNRTIHLAETDKDALTISQSAQATAVVPVKPRCRVD